MKDNINLYEMYLSEIRGLVNIALVEENPLGKVINSPSKYTETLRRFIALRGTGFSSVCLSGREVLERCLNCMIIKRTP